MDPTPTVPAPQLFSLAGQNVLITGATRGMFILQIVSCANLPLPYASPTPHT